MSNLELMFRIVEIAGVVYAILVAHRKERSDETERRLLSSETFNAAVGNIVGSALAKLDTSIRVVATNAADDVFNRRLLALIESNTFAGGREHDALASRIAELSEAIDSLRKQQAEQALSLRDSFKNALVEAIRELKGETE